MPRFLGAGIPAQACPALSGLLPFPGRMPSEAGPEVKRSVASCVIWGRTHPSPHWPPSAHLQNEVIKRVGDLLIFPKRAPFLWEPVSGAEAGCWGGAGRAPGSAVLSPCALARCPGQPAPGGRTKPSARLGATFCDPRRGVCLGRALALAPRQTLCALKRSLVGQRILSTPSGDRGGFTTPG